MQSEDDDSQAFKTVSQTSDQENDDNHSKSGHMNEHSNNNLNHFEQVEQGNYGENDNEQFQDQLTSKSSWSEQILHS